MSFRLESAVVALRYPDPDRVVLDVSNLLWAVPSLAASTAVHVSSTGRENTLVVLRGTLPISYADSRYNIPVTFWIPLAYPSEPPVCYVSPTRNMAIRPNHPKVDPSGFVYDDALREWRPRDGNLVLVADVLTRSFEEIPPVYSAPQQQQPVRHDAQPPAYEHPPAYSAALSETRKAEAVSLRDAVNDRLVKKMGSHLKSMRVKLEDHLKAQERLEKACADLDGLTDLDALGRKLDDSLADVEAKTRMLQEFIEATELKIKNGVEEGDDDEEGSEADFERKLEEDDDDDLDNRIEFEDVKQKQLFEAVAECHALEDAMYHLDVGLGREIVDLATFLKLVRKLSRQLFMNKALILKIQKEIAE